jgi:hypothetical protein
MSNFGVCHVLSVFFATVSASGAIIDAMCLRAVSGSVVTDALCIGANQTRSSHSCNCFNRQVHPHDICAHADPESGNNPYVMNTNDVLDTGCTAMEGSTCFNPVTPNTAASCGNVRNCARYYISNGVQVSYVCDEEVDVTTYELVCFTTDKGSYNKSFGNCWPP